MRTVDPRLTAPTRAVLSALLDNQSLGGYGLTLGAEAHSAADQRNVRVSEHTAEIEPNRSAFDRGNNDS